MENEPEDCLHVQTVGEVMGTSAEACDKNPEVPSYSDMVTCLGGHVKTSCKAVSNVVSLLCV